MKISREDVLRVAELAYLEISEPEIEKLRAELDGILTYIDKLKELDVSGIEPMSQALNEDGASKEALHDDVVRTCDISEDILEQAPRAKAPYFRVPKVIER